MTATDTPPHRWRFFRIGGFDQVRLDSADDLRALAALDPKLWAVLACPTRGLEVDARTLGWLDTDGDGRIRLPEVLQAVREVCAHLRDPGLIFTPGDALPLAEIDDGQDAGALRAAAAQALTWLGQPHADRLSVDDLADDARLFDPAHPNGDGIVPAALAGEDADVAALITRIGNAQGTQTDRSGEPGIDAAAVDAWEAAARAVLDWQAQAQWADWPRGADTAAALDAWAAVQAKVEDYFTRCRLAAFDDRAAAALDAAVERYTELAPQALRGDLAAIADLPLARVSAEVVLPLQGGINPAWASAIADLRERVVQPLLGEREALTAAEWRDLSDRLQGCRDWRAARPDTPLAGEDAADLQAVLAGDALPRLRALFVAEAAAQGPAEQLERLRRLVWWRRDLATVLRNFVNLADFYGRRVPAVFQAGTLYIDQRGCELCLPVEDMGRHAAVAGLSGLYLVYCRCERAGEAPRTIVAAVTAGDTLDFMVPGRNGVFVDRQGRDWQASVVKVVDNPVSVRQAFWLPYRRVARLIGDQLQKFAAARDKAVEAQAAQKVTQGADTAQAATAAPAAKPAPAAFDIARFAGIFAAIGLALGALGTALAAVVTGFLQLPWWQMPLVVLGLMLLISGPSMLLAWLKLRRRNLAPLLDANGWAVNTRARINIPFGTGLTAVAVLPPGSQRSLSDPYAERRSPWRWALPLLIVLVLVVWWGRQAGWWPD